jgi:4-alpha-glucanotransferase
MSDNGRLGNLSPFPQKYRASGVLLHVTSLPSPYGIGDMGPTALAWVDQLHDSGQGWWQALPLGSTGYGNSPYQSLSSFAGNGPLISPDELDRVRHRGRQRLARRPYCGLLMDSSTNTLIRRYRKLKEAA